MIIHLDKIFIGNVPICFLKTLKQFSQSFNIITVALELSFLTLTIITHFLRFGNTVVMQEILFNEASKALNRIDDMNNFYRQLNTFPTSLKIFEKNIKR